MKKAKHKAAAVNPYKCIAILMNIDEMKNCGELPE